MNHASTRHRPVIAAMALRCAEALRVARQLGVRASAGTLVAMTLVAVTSSPASAAIRVNPEGVNVNAQGATSVFLTFGGLDGYVPAEALWCGDLLAVGDGTVRCDPSTIYGMLPARYDRSRLATNALTDIMSIPPSVARRAYVAAAAGRSAEFFYVRRFTKVGAPDQYVRVTCRLTAGGARVPLSLTDVRLAFATDTPVLSIAAGDPVPPVTATIAYTGTGPLRGRWEVVLPGQEPPTQDDLLTEATLPADLRGTQHRYAEIDRFDVFLAPTGRYVLAGPDPARLPTGVGGQYLLLLRIEASDDKEADSDLSAVGAGSGVVHAGAVAGFAMPTLRYIVGQDERANSSASIAVADDAANEAIATALGPPDGARLQPDQPLDLHWPARPGAAFYRVELIVNGDAIHRAFVPAGVTVYRLPPFVFEKAAGHDVMWRVVTVDADVRERQVWGPRRLTTAAAPAAPRQP
jgi:hypothetical protein